MQVAILGASFDTQEENAAFAAKYEFPFPLLCDTDRKIGIAYGAAEAPDAGYAKRVSCLIGEDGKVLKYYDTVSASDHPNEVLRDVADLGTATK